MIARWLRAVADYLDPPMPRQDPLYVKTREIVRDLDEFLGEGCGDTKRGHALIRLIGEFPDARQRDLALAIEEVVQERR